MATLQKIAGMMPIVIAFVAGLFGLLAWRFNERSIRRLARQDHIRMIIEVNRVLIERPNLYCVFPKDEYVAFPETPFDSLKPEQRVQAKSLIDLFFSMFEAIFDFDRHLNWKNFNRRTKADKEYKLEWEAMIVEFFGESPEAIRAWGEDKGVYSQGFQDWIDNLIDTAKKERELEETVRRRAYQLYEDRGRQNGHDVEHWLQAESELHLEQTRASRLRTKQRRVS